MGVYQSEGFELGKEHLYESKDRYNLWWGVTLLSRTGESTYTALVKDGTDRVWPLVHCVNIREAIPHTPVGRPMVEWNEERHTLALHTKSATKRVTLSADPSGTGVRVDHIGGTLTYTEVIKRTPDHSRVYLLFKGADVPTYELLMPVPQHAIYPLLRRIFDFCSVKHNLGIELPDAVEEWERHVTGDGLLYWFSTKTKESTWMEPPEATIEAAFERQIMHAMQASVEEPPRTAEQTREHLDQLDKRIAEAGMEEISVSKDGHCQFSSVAYFVKGGPEHFKAVRSEVVAYIRAHRDFYLAFMDDDFDEYCEQMQHTSRWGDHATLVAAANLYCFEARIIPSTESDVTSICPRNESGDLVKPKQVIYLSYFAEPGAMHYNPVVPKASSSALKIEAKTPEIR
ncbi:hypothetical protein DIPPA_16462 [Diplonema papillatum]|nr:hypothetical protein DIPPA_16462 [Diplonema papillatum]